ncbi:MAG: HutD family protein [Burkholderiales bacterium]|nr:HutD family protein [Burkholderiales bacterium]
MQHWTQADYRSMPWKNGGGSTTELAIFPADATLDNFDWRISTALVTGSGPFSHFAGIDRSLAVLEGSMRLSSLEQELGMLTPDSPLCRFAGELSLHAELYSAWVLDLNVMSRRQRYSHYVQRLSGEMHEIDLPDARQCLLYCVHGGAKLHSAAQDVVVTLQAGELLMLDAGAGDILRFQLSSGADSLLYLIRFSPNGDPHYAA